MGNARTEVLFEKTSSEMRVEAKKLRTEFEEYLEDLELFSDPKFWNAVKQAEEGKATKYKDFDEFRKQMGI